MQLTIDSYENPAVLRAAAQLLETMATAREEEPVVPLDYPVDIVDVDPAAETLNPVPPEEVVDAPAVPGSVTEVPTLPPETAAPPTGPQPGEVETDASGRVWDARIDSSSKAKNKDGTWKARRGVDPAVREQVLAEILAGPATETPPAGPGTEPDPATVFGGAGNAPAPEGGTPAPEAPATEGWDWPTLLAKMGEKSSAGTLNQDKVLAFLSANGVESVPLLATRPDLFDAFAREAEL